jgi:hypothetical protein
MFPKQNVYFFQFSQQLEGLWLSKEHEILYAVASHITFICPMSFNSFPLDVQVCKFQVGSFNYDMTKIEFRYETQFKTFKLKLQHLGLHNIVTMTMKTHIYV